MEALRSLRENGFAVLQGVVDATDVASHVGQIEAELNLTRKSGGSTEKDRTLDAISLGARATWPTRGRRRIVETAPLGEGEHWERLRAGGRMRGFLDNALGADAWEIRSNSAESSTRFFYAPVVFPEAPCAESRAACATSAAAHKSDGAVVELLSWKEDFALHGAPPPPRCWQPVNRRRVRGKGWHIDTGPGVPPTSARTLKGDPRQGLVALLVLSDWEVGGGGTCFVRGSHRWVCDHLLEREERDVAAGRLDTDGSETHEDLNQWCVDEMLRRARAGTLRRSVLVAGSEDDVAGGAPRRSEGGGGMGDVCVVVAKRGDIVIFHPWVIHCGTTNLRATPRLMANGMVRLKHDAFARSGHAVLARTVRERRAARAADAAAASARATVRDGAFADCFENTALSANAAPIERVAVDGVPGAFILRGVLSAAECARLEGGVRLLHAAGELSLCTVTFCPYPAHNVTLRLLHDVADARRRAARAGPAALSAGSSAGTTSSTSAPRRDSQHHVPCHVAPSVVAPLARRLRPWLPSTPGGACESAATLAPSDSDAVSSFFRCYLYRDGDCSTPHFDRSFRVHSAASAPSTASGARGGAKRAPARHGGELLRFSAYSLLLYLNDGFDGGETSFFNPDPSLRVSRRGLTVPPAEAAKLGIAARVTPRRGDCLIFPHGAHCGGCHASPLHEGTTVHGGEKVIIRSDLVYEPGTATERAVARQERKRAHVAASAGAVVGGSGVARAAAAGRSSKQGKAQPSAATRTTRDIRRDAFFDALGAIVRAGTCTLSTHTSTVTLRCEICNSPFDSLSLHL